MRDWFNAIFLFIGTSSLTDQEFNSINALNITTNEYSQAAYDELAKVLLSREAVSTMQSRLVGIFRAKGATIAEMAIAKTNIYIGDVL